MKLYHVSLDWTKDNVFEPRIPTNRMDEEDSVTPRICLSTSVAGCLSAIPGGGSKLADLLEGTKSIIKVFVFDTENMNLQEGDLLDHHVLYQEYNVLDAPHTEEYWSLVALEATTSHFVFVDGWDEGTEDVYPYEVEKAAESQFDGDVEEAYFTIVGGMLPCMNLIQDTELLWDVIPEGTELYDVEFDVIDESIVGRFFAIEDYGFIPKLTAKEDVSLKKFTDELELFSRIYG